MVQMSPRRKGGFNLPDKVLTDLLLENAGLADDRLCMATAAVRFSAFDRVPKKLQEQW